MKAVKRTVLIVVILFAALFVGAYFAGGSQDEPDLNDPDQQSNEIELKDNQAPEGTIDQKQKPKNNEDVAVIATDKGEVVVRLFPEGAPETVKNFKELSADDKYDDVKFHRIVKDFMVQTGDFENGDGTGGYSYKGKDTSIDNEIHPDLTHIQGAVSMANSGPDTNGSQFFIVEAGEGVAALDRSYTVFGQVVKGMDVVGDIASVKVEDSGQGEQSSPLKDVFMKSVTIKKYGEVK